MRNIRLDLEYDGRNYCGWQWQPGQPSIERTLKEAIETLVRHEVVVYSSGRTDSGVHAEQHVAHFFSETTIPNFRILAGLNSLIPDDIVVYRSIDMPIDWSARHDALEREYRYSFYCHPLTSAFFRHWTYWVKKPIDKDAMRAAARHLEGKHDFTAFRSTHCDAENPVRKMLEVSFWEQGDLLHLKVRGHAFLRHQVRTFAGTLLEVGLGRISPDNIPAILESKKRDIAGPTLAAHGLTLAAVRYEGDEERFAGERRTRRFFGAMG